MVRVILDSNFLFIPLQFRVDVFRELELLLGRAEPLVLSTTIEELKALLNRGSTKSRKQALFALDLATKCKIVSVDRKADESYDDIVVQVAIKLKCPVATNDRVMRKRLRKAEVANIFLREKSHLGIEGYT